MFHLLIVLLMLNYCKTILHKVSFDPLLFEKELTKSINWLKNSEKEDLIQWCKNEFRLPKNYLENRLN